MRPLASCTNRTLDGPPMRMVQQRRDGGWSVGCVLGGGCENIVRSGLAKHRGARVQGIDQCSDASHHFSSLALDNSPAERISLAAIFSRSTAITTDLRLK